MIKTLLLNPLGPSLILALGGLLLMPLRLRAQGAARARWSMLAAWLVLLVAGLDLLLVRGPAARAAVQWSWQPLTLPGSSLAWRLDGWGWLTALLLLFVTAAALALQEDSASDPSATSRSVRTLWLAAAALAFVASDNLVTLASCWVLLDAALAWRLLPGVSARPAARVWSLLSLGAVALLAALVFLGPNGSRQSLSSGALPPLALGLLWLAALVRSGAYPVHLWLTGAGQLEPADELALHLLGPAAGIWLLARVDQLGGAAWLHRPEWAVLGTVALLGSALAAWAAPDARAAWRWVAINRASLAVLIVCVADLAGPTALVWPLVTFAAGGALLAVGRRVRERWQWNLPLWLGALVVWGLPGTPGFLARSVLMLQVSTAGELPAALGTALYVILLLAEMLLGAALWEMAVKRAAQAEPALAGGDAAAVGAAEGGAPVRPAPAQSILRLGAATVMLAVPLLVWGIAPRQPAILAGLSPASGLPWNLLQALFTARRSVWALLLLSGVGGLALGRLHDRIFGSMRGWQQGISVLVSLEWLYQAIAAGVAMAGSGLVYFARLGEGEGYMGWLALAALILWMLLR